MNVPQYGKNEQENEQFWDKLSKDIDSKIIFAGYLNGHSGSNNESYEQVHRGIGNGERSKEGDNILDFGIRMFQEER